MATYRHWSVSLWRDPDDVSHCRILSPDKTERRLISATLCGWRRCFVADQVWFMTRIREEGEVVNVSSSCCTLVTVFLLTNEYSAMLTAFRNLFFCFTYMCLKLILHLLVFIILLCIFFVFTVLWADGVLSSLCVPFCEPMVMNMHDVVWVSCRHCVFRSMSRW